jgi:hypothetical protein
VTFCFRLNGVAVIIGGCACHFNRGVRDLDFLIFGSFEFFIFLNLNFEFQMFFCDTFVPLISRESL